ncbi:hypothetical protein LTR16_012841, partial [Cryomyces antarcticus]
MDLDKDNANPTILLASDLPSRSLSNPSSISKPRADGSTGLFDTLIPSYTYLNDLLAPPCLSSSEADSDDENVFEEIDEQEV